MQDNVALGVITTAIGALAIYKHKPNIQRLLDGTESRVGAKKSPESPTAEPNPPAS